MSGRNQPGQPQNQIIHPPIRYSGQLGLGTTKIFSCKLCGTEWPLEMGDEAETCEQWATLVSRKLPKPCPLSATVELRVIARLCTLGVQAKTILHAIQTLIEGSTTLTEFLRQSQRE